MNKKELLNELFNIVENVCKDGVVSPKEISKLQDWIDNNLVEFLETKYDTLIRLLQKFLDNGEFCGEEQEEFLKTIRSYQ